MTALRLAAAWCGITLGAVSLEAQQPALVPLRAGLTVVQAVVMTTGDAELIVRVEEVNADGVRISYSGQFLTDPGDDPLSALLGGGNKPAGKPQLARVRGVRTVRRADLESARHWQSQFGNGQPQVFPGTTSFNVSALVFNELKTKGQSEFSCSCAPGLEGALGNLGGALGSLLGGSGDTKSLEAFAKLAGTLRRVEARPVPVPVLVNDARVSLPAIHASGKLGTHSGDFYVLDDPQNRLLVRATVGPQSANVVKISFPTDTPHIATALERSGRVDVYGIYFDFGSATLRPESEPVLKEIAAALAKNAAWKLKIDGHTDNIGGDPANLDLSKRRAAAVRDALVARYKINPGRLATDGFGAARPKEPNTTPEGRARNRRVELVRQ